jgi:hypothetical protein
VRDLVVDGQFKAGQAEDAFGGCGGVHARTVEQAWPCGCHIGTGLVKPFL